MEQQAKQPVEIQGDPATNTLIVSAHPDMLPEIERIVTELNETQGAGRERQGDPDLPAARGAR